MNRIVIRLVFALAATVGAWLLPAAARAECGRVAQEHAHSVLTAVERMSLSDPASRTEALLKLNETPVVQPCPDDPGALRAAVFASYQVYTAWRNTLGALIRTQNYRESPSTNKRCEGVWAAQVRETVASEYKAFSRTSPRHTSADDAHVAAYMRTKARKFGFTLPTPYTFKNAVVPLTLQAETVRAHLPAGAICL